MKRLRSPFELGWVVLAAFVGLCLSGLPAHGLQPAGRYGRAADRADRGAGGGDGRPTCRCRSAWSLENRGDEAIEGTLELARDRPLAGEPAEPVPFSVEAGASDRAGVPGHRRRGDLQRPLPDPRLRPVRVGRRAADGPSDPDRRDEAAARGPRADRRWRGSRSACRRIGQLALWRLPVHRSVVQVFGEEPKTMPVGWQGSEPQSRAARCRSGRRRLDGADAARSLAIHPPWYDGQVGHAAGRVSRCSCPRRTPLAAAASPTPSRRPAQGDGVTFRVRVLPHRRPGGQARRGRLRAAHRRQDVAGRPRPT